MLPRPWCTSCATSPRTSTLSEPAGLERTPGLLLLTATAASADAVCYVGLGQVFPANMTGNTVLLAVGLTNDSHAHAVHCATALAAFVIGAAVAGALGTRRRTRALPLLAVELLALVAAALWWILGSSDALPTRLGLIALLGSSMGMQSGVVRHLDVGVSTTYITGTWTAVSTRVAQWLHRTARGPSEQRPPSSDQESHSLGHQVAVLGCYFGTALVSGYALHRIQALASLIPPACLALSWASAWLPRQRR